MKLRFDWSWKHFGFGVYYSQTEQMIALFIGFMGIALDFMKSEIER